MRGPIADLETALPIGLALPAIYQDDDVAQQVSAAVDAVLAPVLLTLDNLHAYVEPAIAPVDFLGWLAGWGGLELDANLDEPSRRAFVAAILGMGRRWGTVSALSRLIEVCTGEVPTIEEPGGVAGGQAPGTPSPGRSAGPITIRVSAAAAERWDAARLTRLATLMTPAHLPVVVEVGP